jgi:hypothetical protein
LRWHQRSTPARRQIISIDEVKRRKNAIRSLKTKMHNSKVSYKAWIYYLVKVNSEEGKQQLRETFSDP